jgi:hypothetical protein
MLRLGPEAIAQLKNETRDSSHGCRTGMVMQKAMLRNQNTNLVTWRSETRGWTQILARYRTPSPTRSIIELVITAGPLILLWFLMRVTLDLGYWVCLFLAVPTAGFLVRLFMIQHDCGHGAFFHHRVVNASQKPSRPASKATAIRLSRSDSCCNAVRSVRASISFLGDSHKIRFVSPFPHRSESGAVIDVMGQTRKSHRRARYVHL